MNTFLDTILMVQNTTDHNKVQQSTKSEKQMRAEGRIISRAIDNYVPLTNSNSGKNGSQTQLTEAVK